MLIDAFVSFFDVVMMYMIRRHLCYSSNIIIIVKEEFAPQKKDIIFNKNRESLPPYKKGGAIYSNQTFMHLQMINLVHLQMENLLNNKVIYGLCKQSQVLLLNQGTDSTSSTWVDTES
jgi:hypothetical protein